MARKKKSSLAEYKRLFRDSDEATPGWDAIDSRLCEVYADQEPRHWGTTIPHALGGPDPIDGISAFECTDGGQPHLHFCTYGYSSLYYDEESAGGDVSGYGFEMTFRLATRLPAKEEPNWVCSLLQNLARYVFSTGRCFGEYHWISANGPIRADFATDIVGLVFLLDPALKSIETPHGRVEFIQAFGITSAELERIKSKAATSREVIEGQRRDNPLLVTELNRRDGKPASAKSSSGGKPGKAGRKSQSTAPRKAARKSTGKSVGKSAGKAVRKAKLKSAGKSRRKSGRGR